MKRFVAILSAVLVGLLCSSVVFAESVGVPSATLKQGEIGIGAEFSYFDREIERDLFLVASPVNTTFIRDNVDMRSKRVYGKISYGIFNEPDDGFLKGAEAFLRLGAAGAEIPNEFIGGSPLTLAFSGATPTSDSFTFSEDFIGDMGFAIGGGVKTTLYQQGPLRVGFTWQITHFKSRDDVNITFPSANDPAEPHFIFRTVGRNLRQTGDLEITENEVALGASCDIDAGNLGTVTP